MIRAMLLQGDQWCGTSWRARPLSFVGLMTLYESNYIRLGWLCGELSALSGHGSARLDTGVDLAFTVTERGPYTTSLEFTLQVDPAATLAEELRLPQLLLRIYHDARVVEASLIRYPGTPQRLPVTGEELEPRWARNVLLNKWLEYCADRGCRFVPASARV